MEDKDVPDTGDLPAPSDDAWERARERVEGAPPLTPDQRDAVAAAAEVARRSADQPPSRWSTIPVVDHPGRG